MRIAIVSLSLLLSSCTTKRPDIFQADFETTKGHFVIEVHRDWAPLGADRFHELVSSGFYDGTRFFRTLPKFVVQWGLSGDPAVTKFWEKNKNLSDDPVVRSNLRGFVTFATGGPNTRTTQLFVNMADNSRLDSRGFSPFGKIVTGMEIFDRLYADYGEGAPNGPGPDQDKIEDQGETYLARDFPMLDKVIKARMVSK